MIRKEMYLAPELNLPFKGMEKKDLREKNTDSNSPFPRSSEVGIFEVCVAQKLRELM